MAGIFARIIEGQIPSRMVWEDDQCVAFLDVRPIAPGHTLVVPRAEIDHWTDLPPSVATHLMQVAHAVGRAQQQVFSPSRIGLMIAGFEVPHTHVHVIPINSMDDLDFANADLNPDQEGLDRHMNELRAVLQADGHSTTSSR